MGQTRVGVVVLGDLGRSPRMQYHVRSLVTHGFMVDFIGLPGSPLPPSISDLVTIRHLAPTPRLLATLPRLLAYVIKTLWQSIMLLLSLPLFSH